ncbi:hypothetical protein C8R44DRAFT_742082 [Mycena epipterygia]|nr:hypothetical protein C8R44DRAFT_742082 [Mycena epipterygia]
MCYVGKWYGRRINAVSTGKNPGVTGGYRWEIGVIGPQGCACVRPGSFPDSLFFEAMWLDVQTESEEKMNIGDNDEGREILPQHVLTKRFVEAAYGKSGPGSEESAQEASVRGRDNEWLLGRASKVEANAMKSKRKGLAETVVLSEEVWAGGGASELWETVEDASQDTTICIYKKQKRRTPRFTRPDFRPCMDAMALGRHHLIVPQRYRQIRATGARIVLSPASGSSGTMPECPKTDFVSSPVTERTCAGPPRWCLRAQSEIQTYPSARNNNLCPTIDPPLPRWRGFGPSATSKSTRTVSALSMACHSEDTAEMQLARARISTPAHRAPSHTDVSTQIEADRACKGWWRVHATPIWASPATEEGVGEDEGACAQSISAIVVPLHREIVTQDQRAKRVHATPVLSEPASEEGVRGPLGEGFPRFLQFPMQQNTAAHETKGDFRSAPSRAEREARTGPSPGQGRTTLAVGVVASKVSRLRRRAGEAGGQELAAFLCRRIRMLVSGMTGRRNSKDKRSWAPLLSNVFVSRSRETWRIYKGSIWRLLLATYHDALPSPRLVSLDVLDHNRIVSVRRFFKFVRNSAQYRFSYSCRAVDARPLASVFMPVVFVWKAYWPGHLSAQNLGDFTLDWPNNRWSRSKYSVAAL